LPVHPRARGEHSLSQSCSKSCCGTSPRTRGTLDVLQGAPVVRRYIPAHAGNTLVVLKSRFHRSVHPRARGEHMDHASKHAGMAGTSPRTRGTRLPYRR